MSNKHSSQLNLLSFFSDQQNFQKVQDNFQKIALITACSKKKLLRPAPAKELYQGSMFKKARRIAEKLRADFFILSAKYGLIGENKIIRPYDTVIRYKKDIKELQKRLDPVLLQHLETYDKVFLIMGSKYQEVLLPFWENINFYCLESKLGMGEYMHLMSEFIALNSEDLVKALEDHSKSMRKEK
jgi:hypothetical protein